LTAGGDFLKPFFFITDILDQKRQLSFLSNTWVRRGACS
jgi:hypothetical protein